MQFGQVTWGGGSVATAADLAAGAATAPTVVQLRALVEWVGEGRPLTQTGLLRRADAVALMDLVGTDDVLDARYPLRSSAELPRLTLLVELAKACGLVRVVRGRLAAVRRRAALFDEPIALVERLLSVLPGPGDDLGDSVVVAAGAHTVEAVFADVVGHGGAVPVARACDVAWEAAMRRFRFVDEVTERQVELERRRCDGDVRRILEVVQGLGVVTVTADMVALTPLGVRAIAAWLGLGTADSDALTVRVTLVGSADPLVWRRLRVPGDIRLDRFHQVLAAAMGWHDSHLHVFECGAGRYGFADPELDIRSDRELALGGVLARPGDRLGHEYDFGDGWRHEITLETVEPGPSDGVRCVGGAGACPPEDVGGLSGYADLRRILADRHDEQHADLLQWMGLGSVAEFDPGAFSVRAADGAIAGALIART